MGRRGSGDLHRDRVLIAMEGWASHYEESAMWNSRYGAAVVIGLLLASVILAAAGRVVFPTVAGL